MEEIKNYINNLSLDSKKRSTSHFKNEVNEIALLISRLSNPLHNYSSSNQLPSENDPKFIGCGLMTKGLSTLMAAFELTLNGYSYEPPILLRNALECFVSAWDIIINPDRFKTWQSVKFKSTRSISRAKDVNPVIEELYRFLSNNYTHIKQLNYSPSILVNNGIPKIQFFGLLDKGKESSREGEVYMCLFVIFICLQFTELSFHRYSDLLETIQLIPGENLAKTQVSKRHKKFLDKYNKIFEGWINNPLEHL